MTLTPRHKRWIVAELAMYGAPSEIARRFSAEFGGEVSRQQVEAYDAGKAHNRETLSADLVGLFDLVRERWDAEVATLPIANKRWRLEKMMEMYEALPATAAKRKLAILEQAAKDAGGLFTNKRDVTSNGQQIKAYAGFDLDEV